MLTCTWPFLDFSSAGRAGSENPTSPPRDFKPDLSEMPLRENPDREVFAGECGVAGGESAEREEDGHGLRCASFCFLEFEKSLSCF